MWDRVDPMCEKYYWMNPYVYCGNSPLRLSDPTGKEVVADSLSQINIMHTLTKEEAKYVRFDENGVLDLKRLNKSRSTSTNFLSLKALAKSETRYNFKVVDNDSSGEAFRVGENNSNYYRGVTELPNAINKPSPDADVYILVGNCLDDAQQTLTTAHEAYGHAYTYEMSHNTIKASHTYFTIGFLKFNVESNTQEPVLMGAPNNIGLELRIKNIINLTKKNYESWTNYK
jgi:hypothetical protein